VGFLVPGHVWGRKGCQRGKDEGQVKMGAKYLGVGFLAKTTG